MTNHSISTLSYLLTDAPLALEPLRILDTRTLQWREWQVTCHALGASHAVTLQSHNCCLTEVLACVAWEQAVPALLTGRADTEWQACIQSQGLVGRVRLTLGSLRLNTDLGESYAPENRLTVVYPAPPHIAPPVTSIGWRSEADSLSIETLHTYPEEDRAVRTTTCFTIAPKES